MKLTLLTTVCVLASLCRSSVALSEDSPELQKQLAGWKPLIEMDSRKQGKRYGHLETQHTGHKQSQTFLFLRAGNTSGRRDGVSYISGYGRRNGRWCLRFPAPKDTPLQSGTAIRLTLRNFYEFRTKSGKLKSMTIALMQDSDYRGLKNGWSNHRLESKTAYRLIVEQERLALLGLTGEAKWIPLADSAWKADDENDITFIVTADAVEFWLNGKRTASQPIEGSLPPLNWVHVNLPHLHWGFLKYRFLQQPQVGSRTTDSKGNEE